MLEQAEVDSLYGVRWPSDIGNVEPPLCGLAHGASGCALSFIELSLATQDIVARETAEKAFSYERSWYFRNELNWPDLREYTRGKHYEIATPSFPVFWCYGAIGIGLTRLKGCMG